MNLHQRCLHYIDLKYLNIISYILISKLYIYISFFSAPGIQFSFEGESLPPCDQIVLPQPQIQAGRPCITLTQLCREALLPHRHATHENCSRSYQTLLLIAGMSYFTVFFYLLSFDYFVLMNRYMVKI